MSGFSVSSASQSVTSRQPHRGAPATGSISGDFAGQPLELTFDRRSQTVTGDVLGHPVHVQTSVDGKHVDGTDGDARIDLNENWSPTQVDLRGAARNGDTSVHFDWTRQQGSGTVGAQPFSEQADENGHVVGQAFGGAVDLQYDPVSGDLEGSLGPSEIHATVTNLDLTDVMQHIYLFAPG